MKDKLVIWTELNRDKIVLLGVQEELSSITYMTPFSYTKLWLGLIYPLVFSSARGGLATQRTSSFNSEETGFTSVTAASTEMDLSELGKNWTNNCRGSCCGSETLSLLVGTRIYMPDRKWELEQLKLIPGYMVKRLNPITILSHTKWLEFTYFWSRTSFAWSNHSYDPLDGV